MPAVAATQALFTPLKVGDITVPNRIQIAPMTRNRSDKTVPSDLMAEYYAQRARGGAGLIVSDGVLITRQGYVEISYRQGSSSILVPQNRI